MKWIVMSIGAAALFGCAANDGPEGSTTSGATTGSGGGGTSGGTSGSGALFGNWCNQDGHGSACSDEAKCTFSAGCLEGSCSCQDGLWTCETTDSCGGEACPAASETKCGDSCAGGAINCLCRCGGGPNFTSCSCNAGNWDCGTSCNQ